MDDDSAPAVEELLRRGVLSRVATADDRLWTACDLALLAEHRLRDTTDPRTVEDAHRRVWEERATNEPPTSVAERERWGNHCFWLWDDGNPVGSVALAADTLGGTLVRLSSLYVFREHRGRGVGTKALQAVLEALGKHGFGVRLDTSWTWNETAQWYLRRGMWVRSWKHDLEFCGSAAMPAPVFTFESQRASVGVHLDARFVELVVARRDGDTLLSFEESPPDKRLREVEWLADSTLSLALALRGWPLVRPGKSAERWCGDSGPPEALGRRIVLWEAWAKKHGWHSTAPRVPGLVFVDWEDG